MKKFLVLFGLSVFVASSLAQEHSEEIAETLPESLSQALEDDSDGNSQESDESADDRELGKRGGSVLPPVKKAAPPKKIVYRVAPKKSAPILRPAPEQVASVTYLHSAPKKSVPRKLQEVTDDSEEPIEEAEESYQHPDEDNEEESDGERNLGGKKNEGYAVPVKAPVPKKVALPVYLGKKGGFYGSGYYRRLSEEEPELSEQAGDSEVLEDGDESEASSEERELGKRSAGAPIPMKVAPPVHKKIAQPAPKIVIRQAPKKIVRAEPKKIVRSAPKKVIPASSQKGNYHRRLQEAGDEGSPLSELEEEIEPEGLEHDDVESEGAELHEDLESENPELTEDRDTAGDAEDDSAEDRFLGGKKSGGGIPVPLPKKVPVPKKLPAPKKIYSSKPIVYRYSKKL